MKKKILFTGLLSMLLVFGFIFTACDPGHGTSPTGFSAEDSSAGLSAEDTSASYKDLQLSSLTGGVRQISIKFNVQNGGRGLTKSYGVVGAEDNSRLVKDSDNFANDFTITTLVPDGSGYVNIWWQGKFLAINPIFLQAKMQLTSNTKYEIVLDYNDIGGASNYEDWVTTKNLYDVVYGRTQELQDSFQNAYNNAAQDKDSTLGGNTVLSSSQTKKITVKFIVKNGGTGLAASDGIVSTQDDSYLVRDSDVFANDFYITITIPEDNKYVNIRWKGITATSTIVTAKMSVGSGGNYEITLDYNGVGNVATQNLYDVVCIGNDKKAREAFDKAWDRAVND